MEETETAPLLPPELEESAFADIYYNVRNEGKGHNVAMWAAWLAHPNPELREKVGLPTTQKKMAGYLGISDRSLRAYAQKYPDLVSIAQNYLVQATIGKYLPGILEAIGVSASTLHGRNGHPDRVLALELLKIRESNPIQPIQLQLPNIEERMAAIYGNNEGHEPRQLPTISEE